MVKDSIIFNKKIGFYSLISAKKLDTNTELYICTPSETIDKINHKN